MLKTVFKFISLLFIVLLLSHNSYSQTKLSLLSQAYHSIELQKILIPQPDFQPFPRWQDRTGWLALSDPARKFLISRGENYLNYEWPALPANLFLEFVRTGNRENFQKLDFARRKALCNLVLAECAEGNGRFMDDIVNGVWAICEESYWGVPAHVGMQKKGSGLPDITEPTVDLFVSETGALLAWTSYLLGSELDRISVLVNQRIQLELEKRLLLPCRERDDFWWMGFTPGVRVNNWNPWVNSNWLTAELLIEKDQAKRVQAVSKIMKSLDAFLNSYPPDGGCDEGPNYWGRAAASAFDVLELLYQSTKGEINLYNESLIQEMGRYIYRTHIANNYFVNIADAAAIVQPDADLIYRYGKKIGDAPLKAFGSYIASLQQTDQLLNGSIGRQLPAIFNFTELLSEKPAAPFLRDVWMPGNQVMIARSQSGSEKGLYVAAQGGHNGESHNHNDVGNFIVYMNGLPMIIDVGVEAYTRKTFSAQRYEIWTMQSAYHNLPTIDGVMQKEGREFAARDVQYSFDEDYAQLRLDIADAYPPEAGINQWIRTIRLNRGKDVQINDAFVLTKEVREIQLTLMTAGNVRLIEPGRINLQNAADNSSAYLQISYDADKLTANFEEIKITDHNLKTVWGERITRILFRSNAPTTKDSWTMTIAP